jgi:hypothetical protein
LLGLDWTSMFKFLMQRLVIWFARALTNLWHLPMSSVLR